MAPIHRQISPHASRLRREMTDVERTLWSILRNRGLDGRKFRRQATIGRYVVDFLRVEARLIVEVDGGQHEALRDRARTAYLQAQGYALIRFWNNDVVSNLDGVISAIAAAVDRRRPSPNPLPQAGEG